MINWNNNFKIKINNPSDFYTKKEITKFLVVKNLMLKYIEDKNNQVIYTNHVINEDISVEVYHHNIKEESEIVYLIKRNPSKKWTHDTTQAYKKLEMDWILIDLNKLSNDIEILNNQIKELVV